MHRQCVLLYTYQRLVNNPNIWEEFTRIKHFHDIIVAIEETCNIKKNGLLKVIETVIANLEYFNIFSVSYTFQSGYCAISLFLHFSYTGKNLGQLLTMEVLWRI